MDPHRRRQQNQLPYEGPSGGRYAHSPLRSHLNSFEDRRHPSPVGSFFPLPAPPLQNAPANHYADVHRHHHYYQDPRRDDVRYYHPDKLHIPPDVACEPRRLEPMDYISRQPPNPRIPERASLPAPVRKRWPEQREVLPRDTWRHDGTEDDTRVRVYEDKRVPFPLGWESLESGVSAGRSHDLQSFHRDLHPRLLVESGGDPSPGRTRPRRDQVFALEDDTAFLHVERYEGRDQRKAGFWGDYYGGGRSRHHSRDAPHEPEPSEVPNLALSRSGFPPDRYGEASLLTLNKARSPPLNPTDSWFSPGKRVQSASDVYGVDNDRGYWGNTSRSKDKKTVPYGREDKQEFVIPRKPSVLSRIQHSVPVWERLEEPNKVSSTVVRPERLEEHMASAVVCPERPEGPKVSSTIVQTMSPGFSDEDVTESHPILRDVSCSSNALGAKEFFIPATASDQNSGERNDTSRTLTKEPTRKTSASPQSNGKIIPRAGNPKRNIRKKSSALSIQTKGSSEAVKLTPNKKVVKELPSNKYFPNSERKNKTLVLSQEEVFDGGPNNLATESLNDQILLKKDEESTQPSISPISDWIDPLGKITNVPLEEESSKEQLRNCTNPNKQILGTDDMVSQSLIVEASDKCETIGLSGALGLNSDGIKPGGNSEMHVSPIPVFPDSSQFVTVAPRTVKTEAENILLCTPTGKLNCGKKAFNLSSEADGNLKSSRNLLLNAAPEPTTERVLAKDVSRSSMNDANKSGISFKNLPNTNDDSNPEKVNSLTGCDGNLNSVVKMQIKRKRKKAKAIGPKIPVLSHSVKEESSQKVISTTFVEGCAKSETILASPNNKRKRKKKRSNDCIVLVPSNLNTTKEKREDGCDKQCSVTSHQDFKPTNGDDNIAMFSDCDLDSKYLKMSNSSGNNGAQLTDTEKCSFLFKPTDAELQKSAEKTSAGLSYPSLQVTDSIKICEDTEHSRKGHTFIPGKSVENLVCLDLGSSPADIGGTSFNISSEAVSPFLEGHGVERVVAQNIELLCPLKHNNVGALLHHAVSESARGLSDFPCSTYLTESSRTFENDDSVHLESKEQKKSVGTGSLQEIFILQDEMSSHRNNASEMVPLAEKIHTSVSAPTSGSVFEKEHIPVDMEAGDAVICSNYLRNHSESRPITPLVLESLRDSKPASKFLKEMSDMKGDPLNIDRSISIHNFSDEVSTDLSLDPNRISISATNMEIKPSGTSLSSDLIFEKTLSNQETRTSVIRNFNVKQNSDNIRFPQKNVIPNAKHYQPASSVAAPSRVAPSPIQKIRHRTWHRADPSALQHVGPKKPQSTVSSSQKELLNKPARPLGAYIRKGNSLVRKSSSVPPQPPASMSASNEKFRHETAKTIASESLSCRPESVNLLKPAGSIERPQTPPLPPINKLSNGSSSLSNHDHPLEVNLERTSKSNGKSPLDIDTEVRNFNLPSTAQSGIAGSKAVVYVKPKSNQLVAATEAENCNLFSHVLEHDKTQMSKSELYYMKKKNQLVRGTSAVGRHPKQEGSASPDVSNKRGKAVLGTTSSKYRNGVPNQIIYKGRTGKHSKSSRVWRLNAKEQSDKTGTRSKYIEDLTSILPWKRPTSQWISKSDNANKHSLDLISRKLRLSRKHDTLYTVSKGGFSLRKSGVRGIGGSNLKWSKSMEKRSRKANEEATLAVAEAEREKRERKKTSLGIGVKGRKCSSRERIFRVGKFRYRMDSSKKNLVRIPDEDPSTSNNQSGRSILASRIPSRLLIGRDEYVRIGNGNKLVRDPKKLIRILASEKVRWSLHTARTRSAKKQQYCQFFTRFGKCKKMGKDCPYIHDPSKIAICTKYLKGVCSGVDCSLTHKIDPKMMPDCSYFLRGHCNKATCPYRHVNVNPTATVCDGFQKGYCAAGDECRKKHNFLCPVFEATGQCPQGSACKLHHPKHENKCKKRKRCEMRRQNKWRYFISTDVEAIRPESVDLGRYKGDKESGDVCSGGTLEYISLKSDGDEDSDEGGKTPPPYLVDLDTDMLDAWQNSPEHPIKPVRIMKCKGLMNVGET